VALHITQSYAPEATPEQTAEVLARAIAREPAGVFTDLRPDGRVAGRPAVTYTEARPGRIIRWAVLSSGPTRISIGCQSPPGREDSITAVCDDAVRSARDVGTEAGPATSNP
ncbi:MAG: type VII secretion-associated protein, partial [Mycobacterium sp.]|nr:type VII secretion-associated protein [Mycobacterium sp.]